MSGCLCGLVVLIACLAVPSLWLGSFYWWYWLIALPAGVWAMMTWFTVAHRLGTSPARRLRAILGLGHGLPELARRLELDVRAMVSFRPAYEERTIPKRNGGQRRLLVPDKETKAIQRRILHRLLKRLNAHDAAHAYEHGRSIATNAAHHVGKSVVIRLDIKDFFAATSAKRVETYFRRIGWNRKASKVLTRMTTHEGGLPQGAPTSPRLANLVNRSLDEWITRFVRGFHGTYTRYADDITVSFPEDWPRKVRGVIQRIRSIVKAHGYRPHGKAKTNIRRRHQQQLVCGIVVNEKVNLPRKKRRWLRAVRHHRETGRAADLDEAQLAGWESYAAMIRKTD